MEIGTRLHMPFEIQKRYKDIKDNMVGKQF
jgi:hypothetical protein